MITHLRTGRRLLLSALLLAGAVGCAGSGGGMSGGEAAASCSGLVTYDNRGYLPTTDTDFTVGERLGTATIVECDDTPNDPGVGIPESRTGAYTVRGSDPADAIAVGDSAAEARLMKVR
ncbi:DUF6281 family protein [Streptomyces regalis]|uniref:Secreted protein n=1 Tax=Streptomyces regalis TaxID=68262 RepID=A0A0X3UYT3_9ACTN|nr:DUF6281 family protein [Streptomyces regalis]KUL36146.1 hypothetical protein ADL12_19245 [Streptomyces regalis]